MTDLYRKLTHRFFSFVLTLVVGLVVVGSPIFADSARGSDRWGASYFPNVPLVTHEGKRVRFFEDLIRDKVVVINFIYTTCPDACPLETSRLAEVQRILGDRVGQDIFMYSISIDPETDTPEVLARYAERYQAAPGWLFLTGKESDIIRLRKKLGLYIDEIQDGSGDHNISLIIGNQSTGRWMKRSPMENPYVLAQQIGDWLHNWKLPPKSNQDYASAPKLRTPSRGEMLFRTRCTSCHTIGAVDIGKPGERLVGPDLLGVTRTRDHKWLRRWLAEPDQMLKERDPIAMGLYAAYNQVPMPNMRLTPVDVDALMDYMESETLRIERTRPKRSDVAGTAPTSCCLKKTPAAHKDPTPPVDEAPRAGMLAASTILGVLGCCFLLCAAGSRRSRFGERRS